jgi:hypothetical protein
MLFNDSVSNKDVMECWKRWEDCCECRLDTDFKKGICGVFQGTSPEFEESERNHRKPL